MRFGYSSFNILSKNVLSDVYECDWHGRLTKVDMLNVGCKQTVGFG